MFPWFGSTIDRECPRTTFRPEAWCRYERGGYPGEGEQVRGFRITFAFLVVSIDMMNEEANGEKVGKIEGDSDFRVNRASKVFKDSLRHSIA